MVPAPRPTTDPRKQKPPPPKHLSPRCAVTTETMREQPNKAVRERNSERKRTIFPRRHLTPRQLKDGYPAAATTGPPPKPATRSFSQGSREVASWPRQNPKREL